MVQYFPVVTGSLTVTGSINVSGGITASGGISISGSIASASFASTASFAATASSADNLLVRNTLTAQTLVVQTITSSVDFVTGSTRFGSLLANTHVFSGSVTMNPGGLFVSGSGRVGINTTNPLSLFDVAVLTSGVRRLLVNYDDSLVTIKSANDSATAESLRVWGDNIYFYTGSAGSELMRLTNTGRVGIGTTTPTSSLSVVKSDNTTAAIGSFAANNLSQQTDIWYGGIRMGGTNANVDLNLASKGTGIVSITGAATFSSTISAGAATFSGKVIGNGFNSFSGDVSIASGVTSTIYTMGDNGLYTVQIIVGGGSLIYSAAAIFYSHSNNGQFVKTIDLYDGANVTLDNSGSAIRITNNGFATLTWNWSILHQRF